MIAQPLGVGERVGVEDRGVHARLACQPLHGVLEHPFKRVWPGACQADHRDAAVAQVHDRDDVQLIAGQHRRFAEAPAAAGGELLWQ